ncbi:hypothetical protein Terro_3984 [Terriglobus roseus DSM 18391]|uniref:Uncharacterized protein n=1 Tax=Terriglobus roseus (strain DSM 18391 / NRRL B-41598 / KBS 63) TaxID=926566 RepID=I3ZLS4_TERRK|nr:hypothetical protein [Terriglobus roseus]AFL90192.1 hypothetical protein Terro_3984 [Terriglobus roseus DSM 18391]
MTRSLSFAALLAFAPLLAAQAVPAPAPATLQIAAVETPILLPADAGTISSSLPDAPSAVATAAPAPDAPAFAAPAFDFGQAPSGVGVGPVAPRFATIILPGQTSVPLHGMEKVVYGLHDSFNLTQLIGVTVSAGWSHLIDSQPHYGTNMEAFGKREGAAALRSTVQTMATDALFSPMFHDDPRYYALGDGHRFVNRVFYAASRVVVTRSSYSMKNKVNVPLLLGYGATAGLNNVYYPDQDRGASNTMQNWGTSLVGAALGFEVSEFLDDALKLVHIRK